MTTIIITIITIIICALRRRPREELVAEAPELPRAGLEAQGEPAQDVLWVALLV